MSFELFDDGSAQKRPRPKNLRGKCTGCRQVRELVELGHRGKYCATCHAKRVARWKKLVSGSYQLGESPPLW